MKLLLDENLSRRLVPALQADYPGTTQVSLVGLERASDAQLCDYAQANGFLICSKDDDFAGLVAARGYRPRLVRIALGNVSNDTILAALVAARARLERAFNDSTVGVVVIEL
ncbi:MAG: DUF5615 family PIN-like protein [Xanthomonadales bacterium]|nr:DUF5615 family PIN-like protein [Xanthomonadales bacterium]